MASPGVMRTPLVGRARELVLLDDRLAAAHRGAGYLVLVAGEPGIGKTRLAEELASVAGEHGARVLWGRCYEGEGAPVYWPWVQILRAHVRERDPAVLRAELGAGAAEIAQLVADVRDRLPDLSAPVPAEPAHARFRLFEAITTFLCNAAATRPLVLILDDLHWADTPSLRLLQFLRHELRTSRLLVLGTYRDSEVDQGHPLTETLVALAREPTTTRIHLPGLGAADVARIIEHVAGSTASEALVAAIADQTEGNPFFVTELARLIADDRSQRDDDGVPRLLVLPQSVREAIGQRLRHLSPACHRLLTVAAVLGREFGLAELARADDLAAEPLLDVLAEAETARVIAAAGMGRYRFSHALIREALYEHVPTARRIRLHRQVGEALEGLYAADIEPHLAELAHHFVQAAPVGDPGKAVTYARRAGDRALAQLA